MHTIKNTLIVVFILLIAGYGCNTTKQEHKISFAGEAQGTYYAITYYDAKNRNFQAEADSLLAAFDQSVSLWVPQSIISRVNQGDTTVVLDDIFRHNFELSIEMARLTNGYFDFTVSPLVEAWGFSFKGKIPMTPARVDSIKSFVNWQNVSLENGKVIKADPRTRFDFNAIAQGHSVDLLGKFLESKGIDRYLVDVGGEIRTKGTKPDGSKWRVGIEKPSLEANDERRIQQVIEIQDKALATSGSYRKYYEENGKRFSHAIDPKTGYPVTHNLLSATVIANSAAEADALATAILVMGREKSFELIEKNSSIEAYFISWDKDKGFVTEWTSGFEAYLTE
jgi:thiamine biosynthesis lipoprotein